MTDNLKHAICSLFEVHQDEKGIQRVVTPLEYPGSGDKIVVRIRPIGNDSYRIDENGESALYAGMADGDLDSDVMLRWVDDLSAFSGVKMEHDETLVATCSDPRLLAATIFRVASAAQQLYALATSRAVRQSSDFKQRLSQAIIEVSSELGLAYRSDVELPHTGKMRADHVIETKTPLIVVAANSAARLLEAEVIQLQYRMRNVPGEVLAVVESQKIVGKKQFERANYFTWKTVTFDDGDLKNLISTLS
ncbi:hypothetical protein ACVCIH_17800 [Burkholderia glumae]|uniref:hypothetical protein n=1 Tax=Burkholderia glumae TaxID=337 RepID=UPI002036C5E4|nr:hypothetical protein [Burkholderia glumae]MCM2493283.1 hypothetical protein [Burkholderia glumae]